MIIIAVEIVVVALAADPMPLINKIQPGRELKGSSSTSSTYFKRKYV